MRFTRRDFLGRALGMAGASVVLPSVFVKGLLGPRTVAAAGTPPRSLVLLRFYGGNDGLNTVIPYGNGTYYDKRPTLAVPESSVLAIDGKIGLHPRMAPLKAHFDAGRLAIVQGVGYPDHSLSHFRSEVIWQTADPYGYPPTGWVGRRLDEVAPPNDSQVRGVDVSYSLDPVFATDRAGVLAIPDLDGLSFPTDDGRSEDAARKRALFETLSLESRANPLAEAIGRRGYVISRNVDLYANVPRGTTAAFPDTDLGRALATVSTLIRARHAGTIEADVYQVGIGGFDTHAKQDEPGGHPDLWGDIAQSLDAFHREITAQGVAGDVLVLSYSEFGRRVEENGSKGTDHGTAAPMFVLGDAVAGGVYGTEPDLDALDDDGDLVYAVDFRSVYATVLDKWLGADADNTLGAHFEPVPFLG